MTRTGTMWIALAVSGALALGACGESQDGGEEEPAPAEEGAIGDTVEEETAVAAPDEAASDGSGDGTELALEPLNDSGVDGTVRVTRLDGVSRIVVTLDAASGSETFLAHVHRGACGNDEGVALALADFREASGELRSETVTERGDVDPRGDHFVQVHRGDGTPVACADLDDGTGSTAGDWDSSLDTAEEDAGQAD